MERQMAICRRDNSSVFWVEFMFNGRRYRQNTGTTNRSRQKGDVHDVSRDGNDSRDPDALREAVDSGVHGIQFTRR
jgi:hypothetical protein